MKIEDLPTEEREPLQRYIDELKRGDVWESMDTFWPMLPSCPHQAFRREGDTLVPIEDNPTK